MTFHIGSRSGTYCGYAGSVLTLKWIIRHHRVAGVLLFLFGCRECGELLAESLRNARPV